MTDVTTTFHPVILGVTVNKTGHTSNRGRGRTTHNLGTVAVPAVAQWHACAARRLVVRACKTRGQDVRLRRQVGGSWRRSKRQSAFYLQGHPAAHIAGRADTHLDALPPGPEGANPSGPCEPMGGTTIRSCCHAVTDLLCHRPRPVSPNVGVNISLSHILSASV